jgi:L-lactate dehydrogenase complex protein LldE
MEVALMIPCYIDMFYPQVGVATLEMLEKLGVDMVYPAGQTCCGQPMANSGCYNQAKGTEEHFIQTFDGFEYIVTPSGSCTHHVRNKFTAADDSPARQRITSRIFDLVEYLHDVLNIREFPWASFEHKVALHTSCSAIRGLSMASMSERVGCSFVQALFVQPPTRRVTARQGAQEFSSCCPHFSVNRCREQESTRVGSAPRAFWASGGDC